MPCSHIPPFRETRVSVPNCCRQQVDRNGLIQFSNHTQKTGIEATQAIKPESPCGSRKDIALNQMRMLETLSSVQMAHDRRMRVFPNTQKSFRRMLIIAQRQDAVVQCTPWTLLVIGRTFSRRQQNIRFECIFKEAVNSCSDLYGKVSFLSSNPKKRKKK